MDNCVDQVCLAKFVSKFKDAGKSLCFLEPSRSNNINQSHFLQGDAFWFAHNIPATFQWLMNHVVTILSDCTA